MTCIYSKLRLAFIFWVFVVCTIRTVAADSSIWHEQYPPVLPPAARVPNMVFDEARNVCVLFGGAHNEG